MRSLPLVLLCVAAASALSSFHLVARQESLTTTETDYITQTTEATATTTSISTQTDTEIVTSTAVVTSTSILSEDIDSTSIVFVTSILTITQNATSYMTVRRTIDIVQDFITVESSDNVGATTTFTEYTTYNNYITLPPATSTTYYVLPTTTVYVWEINTTSTFYAFATTTTTIEYAVNTLYVYSYVTSSTCGPTPDPTSNPTSSAPNPWVTVTLYTDSQCSIAGVSTTLATARQNSWPACLQWGENIIGQAPGFISWIYGNGDCSVIGGNGTVSTTFNPRSYCAVVQATAIQVFCKRKFLIPLGIPLYLDDSVQPTWDHCLQHGAAVIGLAQGWVTWDSPTRVCQVLGDAPGLTFFYSASETTDYAAVGFAGIPSSLNTSCVNVNPLY